MKIEIYHYLSSSGRDLIEAYLDKLDLATKDEILIFLKGFKQNSIFRQPPYSKKITKDIFEIRIKVHDHYRILYAFVYKDSIILLNIFKKKTNKTPKKELDLALKRFKQYVKS